MSNDKVSKVGNDSLVTIEKRMLSIDLINDRDKALDLFKVLAKGKVAKDKSPEDLMAMYLKSTELGLGFASAADHMHVVKGKTGIDIHIIKALLLKAGSGIHWEKTKDYEPQYQYTDKDNNIWVRPISADPDKFLPRECAYVYDKASTEKADKEGRNPVWKSPTTPIDWITEYKFTREIKMPLSGDIKTIVEISSFSWREALLAKLPTDNNGNLNPDSVWQKYRKLMIDHRAFTPGARTIGGDLLMGVYETKELYDMNNKNYTVDTDGILVD